MKKKVDFEKLKWITEPARYIQRKERLIMETEPHTALKSSGTNQSAGQIEIDVSGNFFFEMQVDFSYETVFDECGFVLYADHKKKAVIRTTKKDPVCHWLASVVYYEEGGDRSGREIGSAIRKMFYRMWYRNGEVRIQYSFAGKKFTDLRQFHVDPEVGITSIGLYACSPNDSYFDCTFTNIYLDEEEKRLEK